jgi:hypothetical protein
MGPSPANACNVVEVGDRVEQQIRRLPGHERADEQAIAIEIERWRRASRFLEHRRIGPIRDHG